VRIQDSTTSSLDSIPAQTHRPVGHELVQGSKDDIMHGPRTGGLQISRQHDPRPGLHPSAADSPSCRP